MDGARIADLDELSTDDTFLFRVRPVDGGDVREAILYRLADGDSTNGDSPDDSADSDETDEADVACWLNYCQHFTHIKLDKGSGAPFRDGEILCTNHGAMFSSDTGECTYGPCEGALLDPVGVAVADGGVYLTDEAYEFVAVGPEPKDPTDLSSSSNVEF